MLRRKKTNSRTECAGWLQVAFHDFRRLACSRSGLHCRIFVSTQCCTLSCSSLWLLLFLSLSLCRYIYCIYFLPQPKCQRSNDFWPPAVWISSKFCPPYRVVLRCPLSPPDAQGSVHLDFSLVAQRRFETPLVCDLLFFLFWCIPQFTFSQGACWCGTCFSWCWPHSHPELNEGAALSHVICRKLKIKNTGLFWGLQCLRNR